MRRIGSTFALAPTSPPITPANERARAKAVRGDHTVGYRNPPVWTQFAPGKSGNPRGRPRGLKPVSQSLREALSRRIVVHENGRERRIRVQDAIIQGLVADAARRSPNALKLLFFLIDRYSDSGEAAIDGALDADDAAIIESYVTKFQSEQASDRSVTSEQPGSLENS